jgi:hypothetical protein
VIEISNPVGAVIVISAVNALPETVKFCSAEGEPLQLVNAASGVPVTLIVCAFDVIERVRVAIKAKHNFDNFGRK